MKYTTIYAKLRSPTGETVNATIIIRDEFACSTFSDPKLAEKLAKAEKEKGKDVVYSPTVNGIIEKFKDMKMVQIVEKIGREMKNAGGKLVVR